jgi:hypothetical protein
LPMSAYFKLIQLLMDIQNELTSNCTGIYFLTHDPGKWKGAYGIITALWDPLENLSITFNNSYNCINT